MQETPRSYKTNNSSVVLAQIKVVFGKQLNRQKCEITRNAEWRNPLTGENEIRTTNKIASSHLANVLSLVMPISKLPIPT